MVQPLSPQTQPVPSAVLTFVLHLLLLAGFALALLFYGVGYNHLFLLGSSTCAVLALSLQGPRSFLAALTQNPRAVLLALALLLALILHQLLLSVSPETSFTPSWILAAAPLWFLVVLQMGRAPVASQGAFILLFCVVSGLMLISAVRLVVFGTRPADPLADVSGYGALLYLIMIPALHCWLCGSPLRALANARAYALTALVLLLTLLACIVIVATASRACIGLVGLALVYWAVLAVRSRVDLSRYLLLLAVALSAFAIASLGSNVVQNSMGQNLQQDSAMDQRLLLADAGLTLAAQHAPWGAGVFTFPLHYPMLRSTADQTSAGQYIHNDYLQFAAEGGVLLLVPLLLIALAVFRGNWQTLIAKQVRADPEQLRRAGGWLALALVLLHALVNFVFYTLALGLVIGAVAAWTLGGSKPLPPSRSPVVARASKGIIAAWLVGITLAWLNLGYLALDNTNLAVFSGQPGLPGAAALRGSAQRQQEFARISARLNGERSLPLLVLAMQEKQRLQQRSPLSQFEQVEAAFERAIAVNPWNGSAYIGLADLLHLKAQALGGDAAKPHAESLQQAVATLDRGLQYAPADIDLLQAKAALLEVTQGPAAAVALLLERAFPWLEYYWILSSKRANELLETLGRGTLALGDDAAFAKVREARAQLLARPAPAQEPSVWFMRWQQSRLSKTKADMP